MYIEARAPVESCTLIPQMYTRTLDTAIRSRQVDVYVVSFTLVL